MNADPWASLIFALLRSDFFQRIASASRDRESWRLALVGLGLASSQQQQGNSEQLMNRSSSKTSEASRSTLNDVSSLPASHAVSLFLRAAFGPSCQQWLPLRRTHERICSELIRGIFMRRLNSHAVKETVVHESSQVPILESSSAASTRPSSRESGASCGHEPARIYGSFIYGVLQDVLTSNCFHEPTAGQRQAQCLISILQRRASGHSEAHQCESSSSDPSGGSLKSPDCSSSRLCDFFLLLSMKVFANATCSEGLWFEDCAIEAVREGLGDYAPPNSTVHARLLVMKGAQLFPESYCLALLNILRNTVAALMLPSYSADLQQSSAHHEADHPLRRCHSFQEPSVILSVASQLMSSLPYTYSTENSNYSIEMSNFEIREMNLFSALCLLWKRPITENSFGVSPVNHGVVSASALPLQLKIKNLCIALEHQFTATVKQSFIEPDYRGVNNVIIRGIQITIDCDLTMAGPTFIGCSVVLGDVENTLSLTNAGLLSEIVAHAVLDWFKEPLIKVLETSATEGIKCYLENACKECSEGYWAGLRESLGPLVLEDMVESLQCGFPAHGFPF